MKDQYIKTFLLIIFFLVGCSDLPVSSVRKIDPQLELQVAGIEKMLGIRINYSIQLGNLEGAATGRCNRRLNGSLITIDRKDYEDNKSNPLVTEYVLLHEIMHCSFGFSHDDTYFSSIEALAPPGLANCPVTIMNSEMNEFCYEYNRMYYIGEILSRI